MTTDVDAEIRDIENQIRELNNRIRKLKKTQEIDCPSCGGSGKVKKPYSDHPFSRWNIYSAMNDFFTYPYNLTTTVKESSNKKKKSDGDE